MNPEHEAALAWHLADTYGNLLPEMTATMMFVSLGAGDHRVVIRNILKALAEQGDRIEPLTAQRVWAWIHRYSQHAEFRPLFEAVVGGQIDRRVRSGDFEGFAKRRGSGS